MAKKISVGIPLSWPYVPSMFLNSWTRMIGETVGKYEVELLVSNSSMIETMRELIADMFIERGTDYIVWLDADQVYPGETLVKLVGHLENGYEVVGGVTPFKNDGEPMVWSEDEPTGLWRRERMFLTGRGMVQVEAMGFGGVAIRRDVFERVGKPYFKRLANKTGERLLGEDLSFFKRCKEAGIKVWCDTDLIFQHVVSYAVSINDPIFWVKKEG